MKWLVTGGAGLIGSRVVDKMVDAGHEVYVIDNLSTGKKDRLNSKSILKIMDICDFNDVEIIMRKENFYGVIHLAAKKDASESIKDPDLYFQTNLAATVNLMNCAYKYGANNFIFASSAAVYGDSDIPVSENSNLNPVSPYGRSKMYAEKYLSKFAKDKDFNVCSLRYFNIAEEFFKSIINQKHINIFGNSYATKDGTCVRDYVDLDDLALVHVAIANTISIGSIPNVLNVGTGIGTSTLELANVLGIDYTFVEERTGDIVHSIADISKIKNAIGFAPSKAVKDIAESIKNTLD
jgi:UDP-glucose 4-epimerase